jgi:hypothetical protein
MQNIFHHNSSGNAAFTGDLLSREVLRATSLHPIKQHEYQYRLHNFLNMRKIIDLRQRALELRREVFKLKRELLAIDNDLSSSESDKQSTTTTTTTQAAAAAAVNNIEIYSEFENLILNKNENLSVDSLANRFFAEPSYLTVKSSGGGSALSVSTNTSSRYNEFDFEFFTRSLFSATYISPKRGLEGYWKRSLVDNVRQVMEDINANSKERGRVIDFKDVLYGYSRHHPLLGLDYIIDILLVYRKYEGRKMTVPVRRHAYLRSTFSDLLFREDSLTSSIFAELPSVYKLKHEMRLNAQNGPPVTLNLSASAAVDEPAAGNVNKNRNKREAAYVSSSDREEKKGFLSRIFHMFFGGASDKTEQLDVSRLLNLTASEERNNEYEVDMNLGGSYRQRIYISKIVSSKSVNFVLPITGRWDIFRRFMVNYENVCLRTNENTKLVIVLFESEFNSGSLIKDEQTGKMIKQSFLIQNLIDFLKRKYPSKVNDDTMSLITSGLNFSRSIGCELGAAFFRVYYFTNF